MTSSVSLSGHLSLLGPRAGERGGKGDDLGGKRFEETLAGAVGNRAPRTGIARDGTQEEPRMWLLDGRMGSRIGLQGSDGSQPFESWDQQAGEASEEDAAADVPALDPPWTGDEAAGSTVDFPEQPVIVNRATDADAASVAAAPPDAGDTADAETKTPAPDASRANRAIADAVATASTATAGQAAARNDQTQHASAGVVDVGQPGAGSKAGDVAPEGDGDARGAANRAGGAASSAVLGSQGVQPVSEGTQDQTQQRSHSEAKRQPIPNDASKARTTTDPSPPATNDQFGGRVSVLGANNVVAPAPAPAQLLGPTSAGLVSEIAAAPGWRSAAQEAALTPGLRSGSQAGAQSLRIQLHPIELGMVTARLTQSGSQMSIEIQVESNDARQRLSNDADQIVKALKSVGIEVERVTIQQAPQSTAATAAQHAGGRDMGSQSQQQAATEGRSNGQGERGAAGGQGDGARHGASETASDHAGGSLYI